MSQNLRLEEVPLSVDMDLRINDSVYYKNALAPSVVVSQDDINYARRNLDLVFKVFRVVADDVAIVTPITWAEYLYMKKELSTMASNTVKDIFTKLVLAYETEINPIPVEPPEEPSDPEVING